MFFYLPYVKVNISFPVFYLLFFSKNFIIQANGKNNSILPDLTLFLRAIFLTGYRRK